ncbi:MAG: PD-(D/E)XK nuclease domain-containing protein, partial [Bacteroidota bacterium]
TFSGLNNVVSYSVLRKKYYDSFGFTQQEADNILAEYKLEDQQTQVKNWYNGYYFGDKEIYNPWSILNFADSNGEFRPYWLSTSANNLVHQIIKDSDKTVKADIQELLNNKPVYATFSENIAFPGLVQTREIILSFLIQTGYLKARFHKFTNQENIYEISIPNQELLNIYQAVVIKWFNDSIGRSNLNEMLKALISGDSELFGEILSSFVVNYLSYYHTSQDHIEKVYHAFVLGMLIQLQGSYRIESERESGYGRVDVLMTPEDKTKPGIIIELKKIRVSENKDSAIAAALTQIEERQYETVLRQQGCQHIMKLAVTFDGKRVWVKKG